MSLRFIRAALSVVFIGLCLGFAFSPGYAGSPGAELPGDVTQVVSSGARLENSKKWLDAIQLYEKAIKAWPENKEVEYGLRRSKIHFAIERRYSDQTFKVSLLGMTQSESLGLFDELFSQIQSNYVEQVSSTSFVAHGTESLFHALMDERFLAANASPRLKANAGRLRVILREQYWNKPVARSEDARATVLTVCQLAHEQLGLKSTPVVLEYIFGGCNALDDYSSFLTPGRLNDLHGNIEGNFVGLGVEIRAEAGQGLLLVNVLPESPASEGGLKPGDHIAVIDGVDVRDLTTDEAAGMLQGPAGSRVAIEVVAADSSAGRRLSLARRSVTVKSIPIARLLDTDRGVGYIQMTSFQKSTVHELDEALSTLRAQGMRSLIWDLRGNPGGLLTTAVEVLDRFISEGGLVSTRGRTSDQNWSYSAHRPGTWNLPLVLLIDGDSASASEIVAGAVKDHHRGTIVGRKSFGKWSVQSIFTVNGNCGLRLTTAKFYSPAGHTLGKIGVRPDVEVAESNRHRTYYRGPEELDTDADVQKAIEVLLRQTASR